MLSGALVSPEPHGTNSIAGPASSTRLAQTKAKPVAEVAESDRSFRARPRSVLGGAARNAVRRVMGVEPRGDVERGVTKRLACWHNLFLQVWCCTRTERGPSLRDLASRASREFSQKTGRKSLGLARNALLPRALPSFDVCLDCNRPRCHRLFQARANSSGKWIIRIRVQIASYSKGTRMKEGQ